MFLTGAVSGEQPKKREPGWGREQKEARAVGRGSASNPPLTNFDLQRAALEEQRVVKQDMNEVRAVYRLRGSQPVPLARPSDTRHPSRILLHRQRPGRALLRCPPLRLSRSRALPQPQCSSLRPRLHPALLRRRALHPLELGLARQRRRARASRSIPLCAFMPRWLSCMSIWVCSAPNRTGPR